MRKVGLAVVCLVAWLAASGLSALGQPVPPRRVALLVGINEYQRRGFAGLRWAENDVKELAAELRKLQFDKVVVMTGSDSGALAPTREQILAQLNRLLADVRKTDVVLVALCGHGQQLPVARANGAREDDGFYCPIDAVLNDPTTMLSLSDLTDRVLRERGGRNLVLVDACRDGAVDRDRGVRTRGIQGRVVALPEDTAILFSCRAGQKSDERDDLKHGVFTYSVLESFRESEESGKPLTWDRLVSSMKDRMAELIEAERQEPIAAGALGRVVLGGRKAAVADVRKPGIPEIREPARSESRTPGLPDTRKPTMDEARKPAIPEAGKPETPEPRPPAGLAPALVSRVRGVDSPSHFHFEKFSSDGRYASMSEGSPKGERFTIYDVGSGEVVSTVLAHPEVGDTCTGGNSAGGMSTDGTRYHVFQSTAASTLEQMEQDIRVYETRTNRPVGTVVHGTDLANAVMGNAAGWCTIHPDNERLVSVKFPLVGTPEMKTMPTLFTTADLRSGRSQSVRLPSSPVRMFDAPPYLVWVDPEEKMNVFNMERGWVELSTRKDAAKLTGYGSYGAFAFLGDGRTLLAGYVVPEVPFANPDPGVNETDLPPGEGKPEECAAQPPAPATTPAPAPAAPLAERPETGTVVGPAASGMVFKPGSAAIREFTADGARDVRLPLQGVWQCFGASLDGRRWGFLCYDEATERWDVVVWDRPGNRVAWRIPAGVGERLDRSQCGLSYDGRFVFLPKAYPLDPKAPRERAEAAIWLLPD